MGPYINSCGARSRRPTSRGRQRGWRPGGRRTSVECLLHSRLAGEERHVTGAAATRVECTRDAMRVPGGQALAARGCWLSGGHLDGGAERGVPALRRAHHHPPRPPAPPAPRPIPPPSRAPLGHVCARRCGVRCEERTCAWAGSSGYALPLSCQVRAGGSRACSAWCAAARQLVELPHARLGDASTRRLGDTRRCASRDQMVGSLMMGHGSPCRGCRRRGTAEAAPAMRATQRHGRHDGPRGPRHKPPRPHPPWPPHRPRVASPSGTRRGGPALRPLREA